MTMIATTETPLQRVVHKYENRICGKWKPDTRFYQQTRINQKRFGMILRGKIEMTVKEAIALAQFFNVSTNDLF